MGDTLLLVGLIMFVLGLLLSYLFYSHLLQQARREIDRLELTLASEEKLYEGRLQLLEDTQDRLHNVFAATSQRALRENNQQFLQLAQESMRRFHAESQSDLEQRRQAVQHLVEPIREALQKPNNKSSSWRKSGKVLLVRSLNNCVN